MQPEIWKPVVGFESEYEVSNLGRIRSVARIKSHEQSVGGKRISVTRNYPSKVLSPGSQDSGHQHVQLGRGKTQRVHTLVLEAFKGPRPEGQEARHLDGQPTNNAAANLEWATHVSNMSDLDRHGTRLIAGKNHQSKLTPEIARIIRARKGTSSQKVLAAEFGVGKSTIQAIHDGRTWRHI